MGPIREDTADTGLPPYTYLPGRTPHPISHPDGHLYGRQPAGNEQFQTVPWHETSSFREGIVLFNAGFYWEAHEKWEGLWIAAGRYGQVADTIKGLIKLSASAVQWRVRKADGAIKHARRGRELLQNGLMATSWNQDDQPNKCWFESVIRIAENLTRLAKADIPMHDDVYPLPIGVIPYWNT